MNAGSRVTGNRGTTGSAIRINNGLFTMNGGTITGNSTSSTNSRGAGVEIVGRSGEFIMTGGSITGNSAHASSGLGGGVYNAGEFNMSGGSVTRNTAAIGVDVFVESGSGPSTGINTTNGLYLLSGTAQVGNIALSAAGTTNISYSGRIRVGLSFTGSVITVDLHGSNTNMTTVRNYWLTGLQNPVLEAGAGVTLNQTIVNRFPLGSFITSNGTKQAISPHRVLATGPIAGFLE